MSLEEELKVSRFQNQRHRLSVNIMYTNNWMTSQMQEVFRNFGVTNQQYNILRILRGKYPLPCTIHELRSKMLDKQPDVSRLLDRIQAKELVERKPNETDRRKMDVVVSAKGLELLSRMEDAVSRFDDFFSNLDDSEIVILNQLLDKVRNYQAKPDGGLV